MVSKNFNVTVLSLKLRAHDQPSPNYRLKVNFYQTFLLPHELRIMTSYVAFDDLSVGDINTKTFKLGVDDSLLHP